MINLVQSQRLHQTLSPVQVQYLQLLQLPLLALEQKIKEELEQNPLLEEGEELQDTMDISVEQSDDETEYEKEMGEEIGIQPKKDDSIFDVSDPIEKEIRANQTEEYSWQEFYEDDDAHNANYSASDDDFEVPTPSVETLSERLFDQLRMLDLTSEEYTLSVEIIGSLDEDGYLRRPLTDIIEETNSKYDYSFTPEHAEAVLGFVQRLDPPGLGSRSLRECLLIQLEALPNSGVTKIIATRLLNDCYQHFINKHFQKILQELHITEDVLKKAIALIQRLNPKPGEGTITQQQNYIIPDFYIARDEDDFIITLNDRGVPPLRVNQTYRKLIMQRNKKYPEDTKKFFKQKFESAKWFILAIQQRRVTMMQVMTCIIHKQKEWFEKGEGYLKPLIYRDIADVIQMDISTISRVVNGKYAQTDWGVFELKYYFSEGIPNSSGDIVSNKEIKNIIKKMIDGENPKKPYSDEEIMQILKEQGYEIARRTVAKYREALHLPVARMRKKFI